MIDTRKVIENLKIMKLVVFALFIKEIKGVDSASRLAYLWLVLEPLSHLVFIMIMFSYRRTHSFNLDFLMFLVVGLVPFFMFKNTYMRLMTAAQTDRGILGFRRVKLFDVYIAKTSFNIFIHSLMFLLLVLGIYGFGYSGKIVNFMEFLGVMALLISVGFGFGMIFSVIITVFKKLPKIVSMLTMPLYILSGVVFPLSIIPVEYQSLLLYNPVVHIIELSREAFITNYKTIYGINMVYPLKVAIVTLFIGLWLYYFRRNRLVVND